MSIETQPAPTSERKKPITSEADTEVTDLEDLFNQSGEQDSENSSAANDTITETASRSRAEKGTRRLADMIFDASEALHDRADKFAAKSDQNIAFDTYADNITTTQSREKADRQTARAEYTAEKMEQVRGVFRGIGRGARGAVVRAGVELRYAQIVIGEKVEQVQDTYSTAKEAVVGKVAEVKSAVKTKTAEIKTAISDTAEDIKQKATLEAELFLHDLRLAVESGKETIDNGINHINDKKKSIVNEYHRAQDIVNSAVSERVSQVGDYFKQRKDAAQVRKAERIAASEARKLESAKQRDILARTANVELQRRLEQREVNKTERAEKALASKRNRAIGRGALKTALKVGLVTGRETYDALTK